MAGPANQPILEGSAVVPGADVVLGDGTTERLDKAALEEPLFHDSQGQSASAGQMLSGFYQQTGTTAQDHVPRQTLADALADGSATGAARLEVKNGGDLTFKRGEELVPFDRILFDIEFTVRAQRNG